MGVAKIMSDMPSSVSLSTEPATKMVTMNMAMMVNTPRNWAITIGALRYTLPTAPPIWTASLLDAPNAIKANTRPLTQSKGWRSW